MSRGPGCLQSLPRVRPRCLPQTRKLASASRCPHFCGGIDRAPHGSRFGEQGRCPWESKPAAGSGSLRGWSCPLLAGLGGRWKTPDLMSYNGVTGSKFWVERRSEPVWTALLWARRWQTLGLWAACHCGQLLYGPRAICDAL